jgi:hypothetical protein
MPSITMATVLSILRTQIYQFCLQIHNSPKGLILMMKAQQSHSMEAGTMVSNKKRKS